MSLPGLGFSPSRLFGLAQFKSKIARRTGIPLTKAGRQRKVGAMIQSLFSKRSGRHLRKRTSHVRVESYAGHVMGVINGNIHRRVIEVTEMVKTKTVQNISVPVRRVTLPTGSTIVVERSKPGQYPRMDTTLLKRTIFSEVIRGKDFVDGFVATPIDYALYLELKMKRPFLSRTLKEQERNLVRKITAPIGTKSKPSGKGRPKGGGGVPRFGMSFSPRHALGIAGLKAKIGRKFIPLTKEGRQRRLGSLFVPF